MNDTWHTELEQDGDRWSFTLMQNGIWHSGGRNYRSRAIRALTGQHGSYLNDEDVVRLDKEARAALTTGEEK